MPLLCHGYLSDKEKEEILNYIQEAVMDLAVKLSTLHAGKRCLPSKGSTSSVAAPANSNGNSTPALHRQSLPFVSNVSTSASNDPGWSNIQIALALLLFYPKAALLVNLLSHPNPPPPTPQHLSIAI